MAAFPTPLSPREVSPTCKEREAMEPHQSFIPCLSRSSSCPSRAAMPQWTPSRPSALLERRSKWNPALNSTAFQAATGVGTGATRSQAASAFQAAGVGTRASSTLYDDLELTSTATEKEIKTAYRRLARQHHPDRAPPHEKEASTVKFLRIHSAYAALSDPHSRAQYDLQLSVSSTRSAGYPKFYSRSASANYGTPRAPSSNYGSPRTPLSSKFCSPRGRSWETDQCWC